jgi:TRAP-type uncharacterized transport system substrate-binding protein
MDATSPSRPQSKKRRRLNAWTLIAAVAGLLIFVVAAGALFLTLRYDTLRIAVGFPGSNDAKLIDAMAKTFARERSPIRLVPIITENAELSATQLREGKTDLAVIRSDELPPEAQAIAILRKNVLVLWASQGRNAKKGPTARITNIEQLSGRKVGLLGRAPANAALLKVVLSLSGVVPEKVEIIQFATSDVAKMAADPALDAFATIGPTDSRITAEAIAVTARSRGEPKFLAIDASEALVKKYPQFESAEIPPSSFGSSPARPEDAVETIGLNHLIVARKSVSETKGANLTRQLFADRQALLRELPGIATLEKPDTDKDASVPVHPGAAAYIDGTERTFVEKYSDVFWAALLVLSGLGSAGAWFRAFFRRDEKAHHSVLRDRLLDLIEKARSERSPQELERIEGEADRILRDTVACHEDGAIDEGQLAAFGLVLEQFRYVAAERKRTMGSVH